MAGRTDRKRGQGPARGAEERESDTARRCESEDRRLLEWYGRISGREGAGRIRRQERRTGQPSREHSRDPPTRKLNGPSRSSPGSPWTSELLAKPRANARTR